MPGNVRDSMASSCCDTIASSVSGHSDLQSAYEDGNAQSQRAKLLQSVQARKQAKQGGMTTSTASNKPLGFTSHSASLSIDVGSGPAAMGHLKPKENFFGGLLDVNITDPFMSGDGILTPPLTPYQATVGLPEADVPTPVMQQAQMPVKPATPPPHARVRAPAQSQSSPTPEQRQAERMSKLRPLSLAASHPQAGQPSGPGPRMNMARKSVASSRSNSVAHGAGGAVTASSSYASMAASNSSGSGSLNHQTTLSVVRQSVVSTQHGGIQLPSINYKRVSRAGSVTSSQAVHGPLGIVNSTGLSIGATPVVDEHAMRYGLMSTRSKQQWLGTSNGNTNGSSFDTLNSSSNLSAAALARLSGSSYASHSSVLARFPALVNGLAGVQETERIGIV
jgi:hypothetical protein